MPQEQDIYSSGAGGGGGKGGGARAAVEAENTLRSSAVARIVEVVSEGPIEGLVGGARGIYINDLPLENADGSSNFPRSEWDNRLGLPSQDYLPGFSAVESETNVATAVSIASNNIAANVSAIADAVRVTIQLPQGLSAQDTNTGDLNGSSVQFSIARRLTGGSWATVGTYTISGKTNNPYEAQYRIERPVGTGTWEVRVTRVTADPGANVRNQTNFQRITEIQNVKVSYPDAAVVGLAIDAETVGNAIPTRAYYVAGRTLRIPNNYNQTTRVYTGLWGGSLTNSTRAIDNPAWVLLDILTNTRYGCGIPDSDIDLFSFYDAAVYNDGTVTYTPEGGSSTNEPRFTFNARIADRPDRLKLIRDVAGAMNANLMYWDGRWVLIQDRPTAPSKLITKANVIDGLFTYRSSPLPERHTAFNVSFNDRGDRHLESIVTVEDTAGIARYGYNSTDIVAFGATTEGQAIRVGRWALDTELNQTELIEFSQGMNGFDLAPGDVVSVYDEDYTATRGAGRVISVVGTTVTLDRPCVISGTSSITILLADGRTLETKELVETFGTLSVVTLVSTLAQPQYQDADFIITSAVSPRQFRITDLTSPEPGIVQVKGVYHDPNKFDRVETGVSTPAKVFSAVRPRTCNAPTSLTITEVMTNSERDGAGLERALLIGWIAPSVGQAVSYEVRYRRNTGAWITATARTNSFEISPARSGTYAIEVAGKTQAGLIGPAVTGAYSIDTTGASASPLSAPTSLQIVGGGTSFTGQDINFQWTNPAGNTGAVATLRDFEVRFIETGGSTTVRTIYVPAVAAGSTQTASYTFAMNTADGGPRRSVQVQVRCRDASNNLSGAATQTFTNPVPDAPTGITVTGGLGNIKITYTRPTDADVRGVLVWRSTTNGFTVGSGNFLYDEAGSYIVDTVSFGTTYYYRLAAYDSFSRPLDGAGLTLSAQQTGTSAPQDGIPEVSTLPDPSGYTGPKIVYLESDGKLYSYVDGDWEVTIPEVSGVADGTITVAKFAAGLRPVEVVGSLPGTPHTEGRMVFLTSDDKLYRNTGSGWVSTVPAADITGTLTNSQIADLAAAKLTGTITSSQIADSAITTAKFAAGIEPIEIVGTLPATGNFQGRVVMLTTDNKLYRHTGSAWVSSVPSTDITGTLTNDQLAAIAAAKVTGQITGTQITDGAISTAKLSAGSVTANELAANSVVAAKIATDAVTATKIQAGAITTAKLAAGAVTANELAANSVVAGKVQAGAISATELAAGAVTTAKLAAGAVTANEIASNAVTAVKILAGTITGDKLVAGTISATQIGADAVTTAKIAAGAVTATELAANSVIAGKIAAGAITATEIASNAITVSKMAVTDFTNLVENGNFLNGTVDGWTALPTNWIIGEKTDAGSASFTNSPTRYMGRVLAAASVAAGMYANSDFVACQPGDQFYTSLSAAIAGTGTYPTDDFRYIIYWLRNDGTQTSTSFYFTSLGTTWTTLENVVTAPANAVGVRYRVYYDNGATGDISFTNAILRRMNGGELIIDGAVSADKIATNAITSDKVAANAIIAGKIAANAVTATSIAADAVTAAKIATNAVTADAILAGTITANKISTYDVRTSNYAEDGSANPTAGVKLSSTNTALKVAAGNFQLGTVTFTDYWFRLVNAIDGSNANGRVFYRGNNDVTVRGGAPDITKFNITSENAADQGGFTMIEFGWTMQPTTSDDNLDGMRYAQLEFYRATDTAAQFTRRAVICDRGYGSTTDSNSANLVGGQFLFCVRQSGSNTWYNASSPFSFYGHIRARIYNGYGPSAWRWFHGSSGGGGTAACANTAGVTLISDTDAPTGAPAAGGGGGGGGLGGACPAPWVKVTLEGGRQIAASDLAQGMRVVAVNDMDLTPVEGGGTIKHVSTRWQQRVRLKLTNGNVTEWSMNHRFYVVGRGWTTIQTLLPGDVIAGPVENVVESILAMGEGQVVSFQVEGAGTYFAGGLLCHNIKYLP